MTKERVVKTSVGEFTLRKPKAGPRNRAMIKAETNSGELKLTILATELLPKTISKRPEDMDVDTKIEHILDDLEIEDYDLLADGLMELLNEHEENITADKKKA